MFPWEERERKVERNGGVGKTQPQSDTPRRVRESLGTREEMGKSVVGESGVRGRTELGGS